MITPEDKKNVLERLDTFDQLLETAGSYITIRSLGYQYASSCN
jgi:hypothetical protein